MLKKRNHLHLERSVLSPLMAVAWGIALQYLIYFVARVEYFFENYSFFSSTLSDGNLGKLLYGSLFLDTPGILYTNLLWIVLMLFPFHLKENRLYHYCLKVLYVVVNTMTLAMNLADSVYFRFTLRRTTTSVFDEFQHEDNMGSIIWTEVVSHWYLVLLAVVLVWLMWRLYFTPRIDISVQNKLRYYVLQTLSLAFATLFVVSGIRGGFLNHWYQYVVAVPLAYIAYRLWKSSKYQTANAKSYAKRKIITALCATTALLLVVTAPIGGWCHLDIRPTALSNANQYTTHTHEAALILNTPFSMIRTIGKSVFVNPNYFTNRQEMESVFNPVHMPDSVGVKRRKNVVVLILESFGREYFGSLNKNVLGENYKGYTPFLDSIVRRSVSFEQSFTNGKQSIDGMPSILTSIPRFIKPFILTPQAMNDLGGMASYLVKEGYQTAFFHGARDGSMGFNGFANSIGYQQYLGREEFDADKRFGGDADFDGTWAIWDEPFLQFFALKMSEMKEPFLTTVFTASSHHPYKVPAKYEGKFPKGQLQIHQCIGYSDHALKEFFKTASQQPWFHNTLFVITCDHTNQSDHAEYMSDSGVFRGPVLFFDPSGELEPGIRPGISQQIDILPTVLGYLGYDKPYVAFGIDLLRTPAEKTWAVNELNGIYQYYKYGYVLQFDGKKTRAIYRIDDYLMAQNLLGKVKEQQQMERELKAIIQQYMERMLNNELVVK